MAKNSKIQPDLNSQRSLLPFAMWHIGRVSVGEISRLLLQSQSRVAEAILDVAHRLSPGEDYSRNALQKLAQMTGIKEFWLEILEQMFQRPAGMEAQSEESANEKVATSFKKQKLKEAESAPVNLQKVVR